MKPKVYIDGKDGTTGLQIYDRLAARDDIGLLLIDEAKRKDPDERKRRKRTSCFCACRTRRLWRPWPWRRAPVPG